MNDNRSGSAQVKVWDPLVRLFHWSLVGGFLVAWLTQEENYGLHLQAGYLLLGLVLFRIVWGIVGSRHARFSDFVRGPRATLGYLGRIARHDAPRTLGHNPAGGAMIVLMLLVTLALTISGVALDAAENRMGPLADSGLRLFLYGDIISEAHEGLSNLMLALVALHLVGVLLASLQHRENLPRSMITGRKRPLE